MLSTDIQMSDTDILIASVVAAWVSALAAWFTVGVILYTFKKSLPDIISERFVKPLDMFLLRREIFEAEAGVLLVVRKKESLVENSQKVSEEGTKLNAQIKYILAHYEVLLYGVEKGQFDEEFVREMMHRRIIGHHEIFKPLIELVRKVPGNSGYSRYFEKYAKKWQSEMEDR